ncbi:MAG: DUF2752 domain-containing protein [Bacteroidales bacterium]|nr:DUF2752 domain-containing protein [Bacteroidales bacterium]
MKFNTIRKIKLSIRDQYILVVVVGILLAVTAIIPEEKISDSGLQVCLHYRILGFQCPFCGISRAISSLMHFHFGQAIQYNFAVVPLFLLYFVEIGYLILKNNKLRYIRNIFLLIVITSFIFIYVLRFIYFLSRF